MSKDFVEIELPQQKSCDGVLFPGVLSPNPSLHLSEFVECVKKEKAWLESLLLSRGAILFRDFPVKTAEDFNQVVEGFGYEECLYVGGFAPRTRVVGRVLTANESEQEIPFHQDLAHDLTLRKILGRGHEKDGLYVFDANSVVAHIAVPSDISRHSFSPQSLDLWHARLGHATFQHVSSLFP